MKQHIFFTFAFMLLFGSFLQAQITIQSTDMPSTGDTIRTSFASNADDFDFTATGNNFSWDFSALRPLTQSLDTFRTVAQTPTVFWLSFITSANIVQRLGSVELIPQITIDDAYQFFHKSTSAYKDVGYGVVVAGTPVPLKFSNPDIVYSFPITAGSTYSSDADLEFTLPNIAYLSIQRNRQSVADGWGTLNTPYGTFEVIRLKSVVVEHDSAYLDSLGQGGNIVRNYTEYKWLAKNRKVPVLTCIEDEMLGRTVFYPDSIRDLSVNLAEFSFAQKLKVSPNPVTDFATIEWGGEKANYVGLTLYDSRGLQLARKQDFLLEAGNRQKLPWNFSRFKPGMYILEIQLQESKQIVKLVVK